MTLEQISAEVERLIRQQLTDLAGEISPTASFEELGMDSLSQVDLLASAEAAFGIEVPDDQVSKFVRVQDLTDFVASLGVG